MAILRIVLLSVVIGVIAYVAPNDYTGADSRGSLLTSQSILDGHRGRVDAYEDQSQRLGKRVHESPNGTVYFFPIGSSLFALPFVAIANEFGSDMQKSSDDTKVQMILSSVVIAVIVFLVWIPLRRFGWPGELLAAGLVVSGPLMSTMGTAYWNIGPAAMFILAAMLILVPRFHDRPNLAALSSLAGVLLISIAWLCRPTMALPGLLLLLHAFISRSRERWLLIASALAAALFSFWMHSALQGSIIPPYYHTGRVGGAINLTAAYGHLFSPSRGLLVYCPHMILALMAIGASLKNQPQRRLLIGAWVWALVHWIAVSRFEHWWGGHSFGPRLMTEAYVALLVSVCYMSTSAIPDGWRKGMGLAFIAFMVVGAWIHVSQGLYEKGTSYWNHYPQNIDRQSERLWNWEAPQFLATQESIFDAWYESQRAHLTPVHPGLLLEPEDESLAISGFRRPNTHMERSLAWGYRENCIIDVIVGPDTYAALGEDDSLSVLLEIGAHRSQRVQVSWEGRELCRATLDGFEPTFLELALSASELSNVLERESPILSLDIIASPLHARGLLMPLWKDPRVYISFWSLQVASVAHGD